MQGALHCYFAYRNPALFSSSEEEKRDERARSGCVVSWTVKCNLWTRSPFTSRGIERGAGSVVLSYQSHPSLLWFYVL